MTNGEEFRVYMKAINRHSSNSEPHLSGDQMIAYFTGKMSAEEHEAAQAHLVSCEDCLALFTSARDFLEPASTAEKEITAAETDDAWESLRQRLNISSHKPTATKETNVVSPDFKRMRDKRMSIVSVALAASLLVSLGGGGALIWQARQLSRQSQDLARQSENKQRELEQRLAQLQQSGDEELKRERELRLAAEKERDQLQNQLATAEVPQQDVPVYIARLTSERDGQEEVKLHLTSAAPSLRLHLLISKPYEFPEFAVELFNERGQLLRRISKLRPAGDAGALNVRLNRATLHAGKYKLRLFGRRGENEQQLGDYVLSVTVTP